MPFKSVIHKQYRDRVNLAADRFRDATFPPEGWLRTTRRSLQMTAAALARRLGVTRASVSRIEKAELEGRVTLKTLRETAEAMNCRLVYAIIPNDSVDDVLARRAREKARQLVTATGHHMALEQQALTPELIEFEVNRIARKLLDEMPQTFWDDEA